MTRTNADASLNGQPIQGGETVQIPVGGGLTTAASVDNHLQTPVPTPPLGTGTPKLYRQAGELEWTIVPTQRFENHTITARLTTYGYYQVFAKILNLPFSFGEVYVYPNPAKGSDTPVLHVEIGQADRVTTRIYDVAGDLVFETRIDKTPILVNGIPAYEEPLDPARFRSGTYIGVVTAERSGKETVRKKYRFTIVK